MFCLEKRNEVFLAFQNSFVVICGNLLLVSHLVSDFTIQCGTVWCSSVSCLNSFGAVYVCVCASIANLA